MKRALSWTAACSAWLLLASTASAALTELPSNRNIDIRMSNDNGARYGSGPDDTYRIIASGGGLNQLHISTDPSPAGVNGQVTSISTTQSTASGTFWITTTGGRGYNDNLILLFSLPGPIEDDFSLKIKSSGYQWEASTAGVVNPVYQEGAVDEVFTKADFLYGPQIAKPGPGNGWTLPFYSGQIISDDPASTQTLMFIDLYVGNHNMRSTIDSGNAKVEFEVSGIYSTIVSFNAYAWAYSANIADASINWTNNLNTLLTAPNQSGYSITTTAVVPEPGQVAMLAVGLCFMLLAVRRTAGNGSVGKELKAWLR